MAVSVAAKQSIGAVKSHHLLACQHLRRGLLAGVSALAFALAAAPAMAVDVDSTVTAGDPGYTATDLSATVNVGMSADGTLTLNNPLESVTQGLTSSFHLGYSTGKSGTLNITGAGVSWIADNTVNIGLNGAGYLNITSGGYLFTKGARIGFNAPSTGVVIVSGASSKWDASTFGFFIGSSGNGSLTIENGGLVSSASVGSISIGSTVTSKGAVTITGSGSRFEYSGSSGIVVGSATGAAGTLTVTDGGALQNAVGGNIATVLLNGSGAGGTTSIVNIGNDATKSAGVFKVSNLTFSTGAGEDTRHLNFKHNETNLLFSSKISGKGVINHHAGTTSLTGDNKTFVGAINVTGGTLKVAGVCRIGSTNNIKIDKGAIFAFEFTGSNYTHSGALGGEGTFVYDSAGITTSLSAMSPTFSGTATVNAGTLKLLTTASLGSALVQVQSGTTLNVESVVPGDLANKLSGAGTVIHSGSFATTLTGDSSDFKGSTQVTNGKLIVGGALSTGAKLGGNVDVSLGAQLAGTGAINGTAQVSGHLIGIVGQTFTINTLNLMPSATISVTVPDEATKLTPAAFKGTYVNYNSATISEIIMPDGYTLVGKSAEFYVFNYGLRTGSITISESAKLPYAASNFKINDIENGYLVLSSKSGPTPPDPTPWDGNYPALKDPTIWSGVTHKFVDGTTWNDGSTFFIGDAEGKPVRVEGFVRIAGLAINGTNYQFQDAGNSAAPGVFSLMPASGESSVELSVASAATATIAIPLGGRDFRKTGAGNLILSAPSNDFSATGTVEDGSLKITGGFNNATFAVSKGQLIVDGQAKNVTVATGGSLSGAGTISKATVAGSLVGTVGTTLTISNLTLQPTAQVTLNVPVGVTAQSASAFKGDSVALNGEIARVNLPEGYTVGNTGASFYMFDYASRSGTIAIADSVKQQYAASDFTFGGIEYGYLVLNPKAPPPPPVPHNANINTVPNPFLWSGIKHTFVDGTGWTHDSAQFAGDGSRQPIQVEGRVLVAGLTVGGSNYSFVDSGNRSAPAVFALQVAGGEQSVPLAVTSGNTATVSVPIGGTSNFVKQGEGRLVFTADSSEYTGTGSVEAGALYIQNNFSQTNFVVGSKDTPAHLRVNGLVNQVTVNQNGSLDGLAVATSGAAPGIRGLVINGGTLKPGNSPGTIRVGAYQQNGGHLELEPGDRIEVVSAPASGSLAATSGRAVFARAANGASVQAKLTNSDTYQFGTPYAFVVAENGVTLTSPGAVTVSGVRTDGTADNRLFTRFAFDAFDREGSFAQTAAVRTVGAVYLERDPTRNFASVALTRNQLAVASALDAQASNGRQPVNAVFDTLLSARADQINDVRVALGQLSGEIHASTQGVLIDESRYLREATLNRTRTSLGKREAASGQGVQQLQSADVALWGQAFGSWGRSDRTSQAAALDRSVGGFVLGADTGFGAGNWRLGFAGGYSRSDIDAKSLPSEAKADNYHLALYAGTRIEDIGPGSIGLRFGLGNTWHRLDTTRQLNAMGLRDTAQAKYDARTFQIYGEAGYELSFSALTVEPYANLAYVNHHTDGFTERSLTGLTGSVLTGASRTDGTGFSTLGVRLSTNVEMGTSKMTLRGGLGWRHAFGDVTPDARFSSAALRAFSVSGTPIAKNALAVEAGVEAEIAQGTSLGVSYNGQIASDAQDHGVRGYLAVRF